MKYFTAIVEKDAETGLFVGYVPGINGAHSQGETLEELNQNLKEVLELLAEDGELPEANQFLGLQQIALSA